MAKDLCKIVCFCSILSSFLLPENAYAYIGPGAGFAFLGSTFVFFLTGVMFLITSLFLPFRWIINKVKGRGIPANARARRVVIVGLDGLEPKLVDRYLKEGLLPNFASLIEEGAYSRLKTTLPALSPVAWSTFQTGVNPGAHNIFDFLTRDKRHCLPLLSSTEIDSIHKVKKIGPFKFRTKRAEVRILRKSQPFWKILGERGIFSNILRVPISYPPERFNGNILSAMCTPDLRGSQGTFSFFSSKVTNSGSASGDGTTGGERTALKETSKDVWSGSLKGPEFKGKHLELPFTVKKLGRENARLTLDKTAYDLTLNTFSDWIEIEFKAGRSKIAGIVRFCLRGIEPDIELYVSPLNIHPEKAALPIGYPLFFPSWIAKRQGLYGTLGLMEDTWARNELALDDKRFLEQTYLTHDERETMFFDLLEKTKEGLCVCVFDASDRIQHMFWRYLDNEHPSPREAEEFSGTIQEMYVRMDGLVGRVRKKINREDILIVLSDHGFASFRRCVNLNKWLLDNNYLVLKPGASPSPDYFIGVDWEKTRAFAVGLSGIYINRMGRESSGIVDNQQAQQLKQELSQKLEALRDPLDQSVAIRRVFDSEKEYSGLYTSEAPDLIVGYAPGYRISWDSITGGMQGEVFSNNTKAWSGDHHVNPEEIPGILITNRALQEESPHIGEIAPTVLDLFAVPIPRYMEGRVLF